LPFFATARREAGSQTEIEDFYYQLRVQVTTGCMTWCHIQGITLEQQQQLLLLLRMMMMIRMLLMMRTSTTSSACR
jgi:hypothetical protein